MIINGTFDTSYDSDYKAFPTDFPWSKEIAKQIAEYDTLWDAYDEQSVKLGTALADVEHAGEKDSRILADAVRAGEPHPGTPTADTTKQALEYAKIATQQTAAAANLAAKRIIIELQKTKAAVFAQVIKMERANIDASIKAYADAEAAVTAAEAQATRVGELTNWFIDEVGSSTERQGTITPRVQTVHLPDFGEWINQPNARHRLDLLEDITNPTPESRRATEAAYVANEIMWAQA